MRRSGLMLALLTLALLVGVAFKGLLLALPEVRGAGSAGQFDTRRAIARLQRVIGDERPHSVDTAANDAVRARIVSELQAIGVTSKITDDFACNGAAPVRSVSCARIRNIVATIGPPGPGHLLLVSHYDSTPVGPGAADDGIGVAVMLEVAAQLARRGPKRPISFLFNEGEEAGLIGARAFLARDPLANDVTRLINLEARGVEGPAIMFETSTPNATAVDWYAHAVARPVANSLSTDFYRLIPNATDINVLAERPYTILNFAIIGNETRYHSPGDTVAALSPRSVQHMGDQALALALDHAAGGAATARPGTRIFADLFGRRLVVLPAVVGLAGLGLLVAALLFLALRQRKGLLRAAGSVVAALAGSAALTFAGHVAVKALRPGEYWRAFPDATGTAILLSAAFASALALLTVARKCEADALRVAFWLLFVLLGAGIAFAAPGASIFFLLSPLLAAIGLAIGGRAKTWLTAVAALVLLLLWAPLIALIEVLLDYDNAWIFAPLFALMLFPALVELRKLATGFVQASLGALAIAALAGWAVVALLPAYSADRKQAFGIEYAVAANGKARWLVVNDGAPLPPAFAGLGRFAGGQEVAWSTRKRWAASAPAGLARPPAVEFVGSRDVAGGRVVSLRLVAHGAEAITLMAPPSAMVREVAAEGWRQRMGGKDDSAADAKATGVSRHFMIRCQGRRCDGMRMNVMLGQRDTVTWTMIGSRPGLPPQARGLLAARPAEAAPQYSADAIIGVARMRF